MCQRVRKHCIFYKKKGRFIELPITATLEEYTKIKKDFAHEVGVNENDEWPFADMMALWEDQRIGQVFYKESLAGPSGKSFCLLKTPDTSAEEIQNAADEIKRSRDVVSLYVIEISELI